MGRMECKYIEGTVCSLLRIDGDALISEGSNGFDLIRFDSIRWIEFIHMKRSFKKTAAGMFVVDGVDFFVHTYLVENVFNSAARQ